MTALEREVMAKFHQLAPDEKRRVRALIELATSQEEAQGAFDYAAWFQKIEALRQQFITPQGGIDGVGILRDLRDGESPNVS